MVCTSLTGQHVVRCFKSMSYLSIYLFIYSKKAFVRICSAYVKNAMCRLRRRRDFLLKGGILPGHFVPFVKQNISDKVTKVVVLAL